MQLNPYDVILQRYHTEKTLVLEKLVNATHNRSIAACDRVQYTFLVAPSATKPMISRAIESIYTGVEVDSVNTIQVKKKPKRRTRHGRGMASGFKKAIVTLKPGHTIGV